MLATPARGGARAPARPFAQQAVDGLPSCAFLGRLLVRAWVARPSLLEGASAPLPAASPVGRDMPGALPDAVARCGAFGPFAPSAEHAVNCFFALHVDVAELDLPVLAFGFPAASIGHLRDLAVPPRDTAAAAHCATTPLLPVAKLAVNTVFRAALLRIARLDLLLVLGIASSTSWTRLLLDASGAGVLTTATGAGAAAPLAPLIPSAVDLTTGRILRAIPRFPEREIAAGTTGAPEADDAAVPCLKANTTGRGAFAPLAPPAHLAICLVTRLGVAALCLDELLRTSLATVSRKGVHLAVPVHLASSACLVAIVPERPPRHYAIDGLLMACLCLMQSAIACFASVFREDKELAITVPLPIAATSGPLGPATKLAVDLGLVEAARACPGATTQLFQVPRALLTSSRSRGLDSSNSHVPTIAAALAASAPSPPVGKLARLREHRIAPCCLFKDALARQTPVLRHILDLSGAVLLPAHRIGGTLAPLGPLRHFAILLCLALCWTGLRLEERAAARFAALVVGLRDTTLSLTEARACGCGPLAPRVEQAWPGDALWRAAFDEGAYADIQLAPSTPAAVVALEDEAVRRFLFQGHRTVPHGGGRTAAGIARSGIRPLRPHTERGFVASTGAVRHFLGHLRFAWLPTVVRKLLNGAMPEALPAALAAVAPFGPGAPLAVLAI
mmetsp:Transcript_26237/g.55660  ORF Transcript_26237/g.55660 Transcript_26237/m.55660 type:complete len:676 (-) Transcript_26237:2058-4085(-)